jgi:hypothetical protein
MHLRGGAAFFALRRHVRKPCPIRCDRNADSEARRSKRLMRSGMRNHGSFEIVPRPGRHPPTAGPTESVQFCTDAAPPASASSSLGRGQRRVALNDAQRYRMNAAECLSSAERRQSPYRLIAVSRSPQQPIGCYWASNRRPWTGFLRLRSLPRRQAAPLLPSAMRGTIQTVPLSASKGHGGQR